MPSCTRCGKEVGEGASFCTACGETLATGSAPAERELLKKEPVGVGTMEEYKVLKLEPTVGRYPVDRMEKEMNEMAKAGWTLCEMTSAGDKHFLWFYLVFKRTV